MSAFEIGKPAPYFCPACQAVPVAGYCRLAGCPTNPETSDLSGGAHDASRRAAEAEQNLPHRVVEELVEALVGLNRALDAYWNLTPGEGAPPDEEAAIRSASMLLAGWVQRNGYDSFKWRGKVAAEEETEAFSLEVRLSAVKP